MRIITVLVLLCISCNEYIANSPPQEIQVQFRADLYQGIQYAPHAASRQILPSGFTRFVRMFELDGVTHFKDTPIQNYTVSDTLVIEIRHKHLYNNVKYQYIDTLRTIKDTTWNITPKH